jgi:hypothetical protein
MVLKLLRVNPSYDGRITATSKWSFSFTDVINSRDKPCFSLVYAELFILVSANESSSDESKFAGFEKSVSFASQS